jgi:hypothetical protein
VHGNATEQVLPNGQKPMLIQSGAYPTWCTGSQPLSMQQHHTIQSHQQHQKLGSVLQHQQWRLYCCIVPQWMSLCKTILSHYELFQNTELFHS